MVKKKKRVDEIVSNSGLEIEVSLLACSPLRSLVGLLDHSITCSLAHDLVYSHPLNLLTVFDSVEASSIHYIEHGNHQA